MALKKVPEENPYAAPLEEDFLRVAWQYRDHFENDAEFQDALRIWPQCPQCGARRITRCPVCHSSGDLFPLADMEYFAAEPETLGAGAVNVCSCGSCADLSPCADETTNDHSDVSSVSDAAPPFALICHVCSEAFVPIFPRYCEWCGHDFGAGEVWDDERVSPDVAEFLERKANEEELDPNETRVMATAVALVLGIALAVAYLLLIQ